MRAVNALGKGPVETAMATPASGGGGGGDGGGFSFEQPPGKPQAPTVSVATPNSLTVEWTEPQNGGSAITDYDVQYREGGSGDGFTNAQHEGTARIAMLTGLNPDTVYEVQVRASNDEGTSFWSESGEGRTSPPLTGDQIYYFPHLAVGESWQTTITYINYSPEEVSCQTDFLSDDGSPLMVSFPGRGMDINRTDVLPPGGVRSPGDQRLAERSSGARLGAGHLLRAGEGQPSVSSVQGGSARGGSRNQFGDSSGNPVRHLRRTGRRPIWDRRGLFQPLRHGGPRHLYCQGCGWADAG